MDLLLSPISHQLSTKKNIKSIKKGFLFYRAINHPIRQHIVNLIAEHKEMNVTSLQIKLRIDQAIVSQQLAILREAKVVKADRRGQFIYYHLNEEMIAKAFDFCYEL